MINFLVFALDCIRLIKGPKSRNMHAPSSCLVGVIPFPSLLVLWVVTVSTMMADCVEWPCRKQLRVKGWKCDALYKLTGQLLYLSKGFLIHIGFHYIIRRLMRSVQSNLNRTLVTQSLTEDSWSYPFIEAHWEAHPESFSSLQHYFLVVIVQLWSHVNM